MAAGTLVPFMSEVGLTGDTFDIDLNADVKTHPTIGPLFGSFKLQLDVFICPIRLYQGILHNNKLGIGMEMSKVQLPRLQLRVSNDYNDNKELQVEPSTLLSYLNIKGAGRIGTGYTDATRNFNAIPWNIVTGKQIGRAHV